MLVTFRSSGAPQDRQLRPALASPAGTRKRLSQDRHSSRSMADGPLDSGSAVIYVVPQDVEIRPGSVTRPHAVGTRHPRSEPGADADVIGSGVARTEADVLAHRVTLHLGGPWPEDVEHADLASLGDPLPQDRLDHAATSGSRRRRALSPPS
jgi:hypothetical protein